MLKKKKWKAIWLAAASCCRQERPCLSVYGRIPLHSPQQVRLPTCTTGWRTVKRQELQKRKGGEKEKQTSELAKASGSAKSKSCGNEGNRRGRQFAAWKPPYPSHLDLSIEDSRQ
ncbi:uncharacterized protein ACIBXB_021585 isoform 1-T1 [Morphnus guianensis]